VVVPKNSFRSLRANKMLPRRLELSLELQVEAPTILPPVLPSSILYAPPIPPTISPTPILPGYLVAVPQPTGTTTSTAIPAEDYITSGEGAPCTTTITSTNSVPLGQGATEFDCLCSAITSTSTGSKPSTITHALSERAQEK
jgi:hypothetical protein